MKNILVVIVMGSDSDLPIMKDAIEIMEKFDIGYDVLMLSAHRSPEATTLLAKNAFDRGVRVIIAAAGGAAHLAGVIAAHTILPVIGVPIKTSTLNGVDSLYSIVQMPPGVPVATVGINAAKNAGLLAVEILAGANKDLQKKLISFKKAQSDTVVNKSEKLQKIGYKEYLKIMEKK
ncbi:5-(carboxyamino)imidazole ribonucleotide mutase [Candidatus Roizmanbacteria bacterium]|nr:5-(carboxyamino)imidazole ribonucleotide mutase [Candidatus Roizmanbacteria bacterium]